MKREQRPSERVLILGIPPVGLGYLGFFIMIGVAMAGTSLIKLIMMSLTHILTFLYN